MCLFITEWTSIGFHCKGLFRTNKRTPYGWSWLPGLCIVISVHKICIADGLPWMPDPYRDPLDTQNGCHRRHTVRIATGHRISVTILGDSCYSRLLGHLHRCLQREPGSVAVDYFWIVSICSRSILPQMIIWTIWVLGEKLTLTVKIQSRDNVFGNSHFLRSPLHESIWFA